MQVRKKAKPGRSQGWRRPRSQLLAVDSIGDALCAGQRGEGRLPSMTHRSTMFVAVVDLT